MKSVDYERTRATLLSKLRDWNDSESWEQFMDAYGRLLHSVAIQAGLNPAEAEDAVQDTLLKVAEKLKTFKYNPAVGSFKSWLLTVVRNRVTDALRKRGRENSRLLREAPTTGGTALIEKVEDPAVKSVDAVWEREWQAKMVEAALGRLRLKVPPKSFQIFDCYVRKEWEPEKVATFFGVSVGQVYLVKNRMTAKLKDEIAELEAGSI